MATNPEVDAWFDDYEHPAKDAMLAVRAIILDDERMTEAIKWKSPTFMYKGNLAMVYREQGRHREALSLMEEALGHLRREPGSDHFFTLEVMANLGNQPLDFPAA